MAVDVVHLDLTSGLQQEEWCHQQKRSLLEVRSCDWLWKEYFRDPTQWWDNRKIKTGTVQPDFKHKITKDCLWVDGRRNPPWVAEELRHRDLSTNVMQSAKAIGKNGRVSSHRDLVASLRECARSRDYLKGTRVHDTISAYGLASQCSDALTIMYAKCGALAKAKELLEQYKSMDIFTWTSVIAGYVRTNQNHDAIHCFEQMQNKGISPDTVTYVSVLRACGNVKAVEKGKEIHDEVIRRGMLGKDPTLGGALVDMYAKCGFLPMAEQVLEELPCRNVQTWNSLLTAYAKQDQVGKVFNGYKRMQRENISPNDVTFSCLLKASAFVGEVKLGEQIHNEIHRRGLLRNNAILGTALVDMYAKCGAFTQARESLDKLPVQDIVAWNALIAGYVEQGEFEGALKCYEQLQHEGLSPNAVTFTSLLKACGSIGACDRGEQFHMVIAQRGFLKDDKMLGNALVDMYARCGALLKARDVLEELPFQDVALWNALISGFVKQGQDEEALHCFEQMQCRDLHPDAVTFMCALKACGATGMIQKGQELHDMIACQRLLLDDLVLGNALIDMYGKCGAPHIAQKVLEELPTRNANSWTALITGYAQVGQGESALICFGRMLQEGLSPDLVTLFCVLNACNHLGLVEDASMHFANMTTRYGLQPSLEHYTCMVDLFGRVGDIGNAIKVVEHMPIVHDFAIWSALLHACWKWRNVDVARWAFEQMILVNSNETSAYVIMANIYADAGMHKDAGIITSMQASTHNKKPKEYPCYLRSPFNFSK